MLSASFSYSSSLGGVTGSSSFLVDGTGMAMVNTTLAAGNASTSWTKTGANTGTAVLGASHTIVNGTKVDVFWTLVDVNYVQYNCTATVTGTSIALASGSGDDFPVNGTDLVVSTKEVYNLKFDCATSNLKALMVTTDKILSCQFVNVGGTVTGSPILLDTAEFYSWFTSLGTAPLTVAIKEVWLASGEASTSNVSVAALYDAGP